MNDLQRALADALLGFILDRRVAGKKLTQTQRDDTTAIARELGLFPAPRRHRYISRRTN